MKTLTVPVIASAFLLIAATAANAQPITPRFLYECQVKAESGYHAYLQVQAESMAKARVVAASAEVRDTEGQPSRSAEVVECVEQDGKDFRDSRFQVYVDRLAQ